MRLELFVGLLKLFYTSRPPSGILDEVRNLSFGSQSRTICIRMQTDSMNGLRYMYEVWVEPAILKTKEGLVSSS